MIRERAIKITLIHNPESGKGKGPSRQKLVKLIRAAGHKVDYQSSKEKKWHRVLKNPGDIIAVAGGDGTVGKVARRVIDGPTPVAILPLGTANNIATSLGMSDLPLKDLITGWTRGRCVHFDAAVAKGPWGSKDFIEGFGLGLFAETMYRIDNSNGKELGPVEDPEDEIDSVLKTLAGQVPKFRPHQLTVRLDGENLSGSYVLFEALNIGFVGPNLNLAPEADTKDGLLDIVTVPSSQRAKLRKYLAGKLNGAELWPELPRHRGRHLQIEWEVSPVHIDDRRWPDDDKSPRIRSHGISVEVDPGALIFLVPDAVSGQAQRRK